MNSEARYDPANGYLPNAPVQNKKTIAGYKRRSSTMELLRDRRSAIELLPDEATPALQAAFDALQTKRTQKIDVLAELNAFLTDRKLPKVSHSGFSRWANKVDAGLVKRPAMSRPREAVPIGEVVLSAETASLLLAAAAAITRELGPKVGG